jgi:hypothetical protein
MKKLQDIIGESKLTDSLAPNSKAFVDLHKVEKVRGLSDATDNDELFNATNVKPSPRPGKSVTEQVIFEWADYGSNPEAQKNDQMQAHLDQARQWGGMSAQSLNMAQRHDYHTQDKNKDQRSRNLHGKAKSLHDELVDVYAKLSKYHNSALGDILNPKDK